jgi:hypothetical protein
MATIGSYLHVDKSERDNRKQSRIACENKKEPKIYTEANHEAGPEIAGTLMRTHGYDR